MEDRYDHEIQLMNIYNQMLEYKIYYEYNNLIDVFHCHRFLNSIRFHLQQLVKKKNKENIEVFVCLFFFFLNSIFKTKEKPLFN